MVDDGPDLRQTRGAQEAETVVSIVVTGAAGFIGAALCERLLQRGETVVGVDDFNAYYAVALKVARADRLAAFPDFTLRRLDVADADAVAALVTDVRPDRVIHLAAQAGVRHSIDNPFAYQRANVAGHLSVLEACRRTDSVRHLLYASSSSVYGERSIDGPFREGEAADTPTSLYAATKRSAELMSAAYSRLYGLPQTGLRFFTVYGPWGRPDMAYYSFTRAIASGEPIEVYGDGRMARDFTYIDDIVDGIVGALDHPPKQGEHRLFNIGDSQPVGLMRMIEILEQALHRPALKRFVPMQPGDVSATYADISKLRALCGYQPKVTLDEGLPRFVEWWREYER